MPQHFEVDVDFGEHFGNAVGAFRFDGGDAAGNFLPLFFGNIDHIGAGAACNAHQQHFHGAGTAPHRAFVCRTFHHHAVALLVAGHKAASFHPTVGNLHFYTFLSEKTVQYIKLPNRAKRDARPAIGR